MGESKLPEGETAADDQMQLFEARESHDQGRLFFELENGRRLHDENFERIFIEEGVENVEHSNRA